MLKWSVRPRVKAVSLLAVPSLNIMHLGWLSLLFILLVATCMRWAKLKFEVDKRSPSSWPLICHFRTAIVGLYWFKQVRVYNYAFIRRARVAFRAAKFAGGRRARTLLTTRTFHYRHVNGGQRFRASGHFWRSHCRYSASTRMPLLQQLPRDCRVRRGKSRPRYLRLCSYITWRNI